MEDSVNDDSPGGESERPWYRATWVIPVLLVAAAVGGVGIGFGIASDRETPSSEFETTAALFVEEEPLITDCELEIAGWVDYLSQNPEIAGNDLALEYGVQSEKFHFIMNLYVQYRSTSLQFGAQRAFEEVYPAIAAFCGVPANGGEPPSALGGDTGDPAVDFFLESQPLCVEYAEATGNSPPDPNRFRNVQAVEVMTEERVLIRDGLGDEFIVDFSSTPGVIYSPEGPDWILPADLSWGCPPDLYLGSVAE